MRAAKQFKCVKESFGPYALTRREDKRTILEEVDLRDDDISEDMHLEVVYKNDLPTDLLQKVEIALKLRTPGPEGTLPLVTDAWILENILEVPQPKAMWKAVMAQDIKNRPEIREGLMRQVAKEQGIQLPPPAVNQPPMMGGAPGMMQGGAPGQLPPGPPTSLLPQVGPPPDPTMGGMPPVGGPPPMAGPPQPPPEVLAMLAGAGL